MKLGMLVEETINRMETKINEENVLKFKENGILNHWYIKDPDIWFANAVIHAIYKPDEICEWYSKYSCNDNHITTLAIHCCKRKGWL